MNHNIIYATSLFSSVFFFLLFTTKDIGLLSYICGDSQEAARQKTIFAKHFE